MPDGRQFKWKPPRLVHWGANPPGIVHWIHGGSTDLDNLILLCHRHHWMAHEGGWQIVRSDDGRMLTIPPVTEFQRLARGPD